MVVADLSDRNPNVFYELAVRHSLRKPYVQIIQRGDRIPFDVSAIRTIEVDHHDLDSVETAKAEILRQMQSLQRPDAVVDSPISVAVDLDVLRRSGKPEERQLGDLMASVADLGTNVASIAQRLEEPSALFPANQLSSLFVQELRPMLLELRESMRPRISERLVAEVAFSLNELRAKLDGQGGTELNRAEFKEALETIIKQMGLKLQSVTPLS